MGQGAKFVCQEMDIQRPRDRLGGLTDSAPLVGSLANSPGVAQNPLNHRGRPGWRGKTDTVDRPLRRLGLASALSAAPADGAAGQQ
jgi:hypothetical protein